MNYRKLGKTSYNISELSLGTWQVGGKWGSGFDHKNADRILNSAIDNGINFIDTADVYEAGLSEQAVGKVIKNRKEKVYIATKCGRQINPHINEGYTTKTLRHYVEQSLKNTGLEQLDLIQLHCPPTEVYYRPEIFELFDRLKEEGKIGALGVSVEKVEEGLKAIEYDNVTSVQIIYNLFRQRPAELFFDQAKKKDVGIIVRVPLASGLLTGQYGLKKKFGQGDHRHFNRNGEAFDKGETFSGIPYDLGVKLSLSLKSKFAPIPLHHVAIKWILQHPSVCTVIPGASHVDQLMDNLSSVQLDDLTINNMAYINDLYRENVKGIIHHCW